MKRTSALIAASALLATLAPQMAAAADLGESYKDAPAERRLRWSGFYAGLNGAGMVDGTAEYDFVPGYDAPFDKNSVSLNGLSVGAQIGYNAQFGAFVAGVEADLNYADLEDTTPCLYLAGGVCSTSMKGLGGVRGRLGVTLTPTILAYATGGWAIAGVKHKIDWGGEQYHDSGVVNGWSVGGGVELMHSSNISFGVEVLHTEFGNDSYVLAGNLGGQVPVDVNIDTTVIKAKVNFHFH